MTSPSESSLFEVPNDIADRAIIDQATTADMRAARRQQIENMIIAVGGIQLMSQNLREGSENASEFNVARDDPRSFGARDGAETPSGSKSNHLDIPTLCPLCWEVAKRSQDLRRHLLDDHLPDSICCPHPACPWHGSRKETLYKHIKRSKTCGEKPKWVHQYEIYDAESILRWFLIDFVAFETVETFVLDLIEERARELKKEDAWGPLTKWRKLTG